MNTVLMKVELESVKLQDLAIVCSGSLVFELDSECTQLHIGRAIYSIEKMGYPIDTHEVFTNVVNAFDDIQLKKSYTKAVELEGFGKVSFKLNK